MNRLGLNKDNVFDVISKREREVVELILDGKVNKEIAQQLFISPKTVKNHLVSIFSKYQVESRLQLAILLVPLVVEREEEAISIKH